MVNKGGLLLDQQIGTEGHQAGPSSFSEHCFTGPHPSSDGQYFREGLHQPTGGTRSCGLMKEATLLILWAEDHLGSIRAEHLPGVANQEADWFSRQNIIEGDRSLHPQVFELIVRSFSRPEIDLFASRENAQVPSFLSRCPDPLALGNNTLLLPWLQTLFTPFHLSL